MSEFRSDGNFIYLNEPYCEFYIPMEYFDSGAKFADDLGDRIDVFGIFNVGFFKDGKLTQMRTMNLPVGIQIFVYDSEIREVELLSADVAVPCKVVKYLKDAKIMSSVIFDDDSYAKTFLQWITSGKVPSIVPYSKVNDVWTKNQKLTGVNFAVPSLYRELILSVMYRDPKDMSKKFASVADEMGDYDYKMGSIRQICQYNSTFTAITFEDVDSMITTSLNKSRNHVKETISPVEQTIKF